MRDKFDCTLDVGGLVVVGLFSAVPSACALGDVDAASSMTDAVALLLWDGIADAARLDDALVLVVAARLDGTVCTACAADVDCADVDRADDVAGGVWVAVVVCVNRAADGAGAACVAGVACGVVDLVDVVIAVELVDVAGVVCDVVAADVDGVTFPACVVCIFDIVCLTGEACCSLCIGFAVI